MKRADELPVEPLSDAAWQRIERGVFEELNRAPRAEDVARARSRRRLVVTLLAGAAALQIAAVFAFFWMRPPDGEPARLASTRLVTNQQASETLLGDVAIYVEPSSALVVVENARAGSLVVLERGAAAFSVPPRERRPAFVVQAGEVRVEVVGTRFRVERVAGSARVDTYEGTVRVVAHGRIKLVRGGEHWVETADAPSGDEPNAAVPTPDSVPSPAGASGASVGPVDADVPPSPPSPSFSGASGRTQTSERAARSPTVSPPAQQLGQGVRTGAVARDVQAVAGSERDRDRQRFEQAAQLEASDPRRALALYGRLVAEGGRWGEPALYAMARLELERGQREDALRLLRRYLARHPRGANVADVRALIVQLTAGAP